MFTFPVSLYSAQRNLSKWRVNLRSPLVTLCTAEWPLYVATCLTFANSTFCPHSVFMCFVWIWEQTAIISLYNINWLVCITETECVYCAVRTEHLIFTNSTFCPHSVFICFVWIWEQTAVISLNTINWLVCITETECVYYSVRTEHLTFTNSTFCPHNIFMCFVWIWEQTAIISLYNINWLVCIKDRVCLLRGTDWGYNIHKFYVLPYQSIYVFCVGLRTNSNYFPIQH